MSHKIKKVKTYNFRVDDEDWGRIRYIIDDAKINLPSVLREHIRKVHDSLTKKDKGVDDMFYGL